MKNLNNAVDASMRPRIMAFLVNIGPHNISDQVTFSCWLHRFIVTGMFRNILKAMKVFTLVSSSRLHNVHVDPEKWRHEIKWNRRNKRPTITPLRHKYKCIGRCNKKDPSQLAAPCTTARWVRVRYINYAYDTYVRLKNNVYAYRTRRPVSVIRRYAWSRAFRSSLNSHRWLVGWSLTSLFSTNTAISETKGQG